MTIIERVHGRRVWDSRGRPTVEAEVTVQGGAVGRAIAPAGASRGSGEAVDLRDGGTRFGGFDVRRALDGIEGPIAAALRGRDASDQEAVDAALVALDGTPDKSRLGGNALTAVSLATAHAAAAARGLPLWRHLAAEAPVALPLPQIQIIGGGAHAARRLDVQDLMVIPIGARTYGDALAIVADVYRVAGDLLAQSGKLAGIADEGGYWPAFDSNEAALATLVRAIEHAGYEPASDVAIALDCAASQLRRGQQYHLALDDRTLDADALAALWLDWLDRYPIVSIEDPFAEDDAPAWKEFARAVGDGVQVVGDDFVVTDAGRIALAAGDRACNAVLLKPNQAGTLTETRAALDMARRSGMGTIVSARSGETEDVTVAHLAVGWNAGQIKVGAFARGERMSKWNELLRIEEAQAGAARFAGASALRIARPSGR